MTGVYILVAVFLLLAGGYAIFAIRRLKKVQDVTPGRYIVILTDRNFQTQINQGVALVDFWAAWCVPCKIMSPVLNDLAEDMQHRATVCKLDVEKFPNLAAKYSIRNIPTLVLFLNGKEIDRFVGIKSKEFLAKQIAKLL